MTDTAGVTDGHSVIIIFNFFYFVIVPVVANETVLKASSRQSPAHMRNHRNAYQKKERPIFIENLWNSPAVYIGHPFL